MPKPLLALLILPILLAGCAQNNVTQDNSFKKYFDSAGVTGSFGLFDNGQGHFTIYNLPRFRDSSYLPAASFEIPLSLIAIQTGVIKDDSAVIFPAQMVMTVDSTDPGNHPVLHPAMTLAESFRSPDDLGFAELAKRIGRDTLKRWIDSLGYGNKNITGPVESFWQNNHLKITADEQLGMVKKLYFDQLPFFQRTQKVVRNMMLMESNANYRLSYKAGWGTKEDGHLIDWTVGWVEENNHLYFFVLNLESPVNDPAIRGDRMTILKNILGQMGFLEGKK